nr:glutathione S-transferase T3-like [Tanacetum cinerariifolium]
MTKRATVDLVEEDDDQSRQCARWTREEEIFLCQCWIENSENGEIEADRSVDSFWGHIMQDFNNSKIQGFRTKNMLTGKWSRVNGDCQKFNAIYKQLERKSGGNKADHIETPKVNFAAQQQKKRKLLIDHAPEVKPLPVGKTTPAKKTKSEMTRSSGGSTSGSIFI